MDDYRLCVIESSSTRLAVGHRPRPNIWWNHLERVMMAYEDLECREL
jgi:hypothetical protein